MADTTGCLTCTGTTTTTAGTDYTWLLYLGAALAVVAIIQSELNDKKGS